MNCPLCGQDAGERMSEAEAFEWIAECLRWWGRVLHGHHMHYCFEWDFLPVDETVGEYVACHCFEELP